MKSKEEFLKEYRSKHTGMYVAAVLSVIFDIIGTVIILANVIPLIKYRYIYSEGQTVFWLVLGMVFWIIGTVLIIYSKSVDRRGLSEYENYLKNQASVTAFGREAANHNSSDEWVCKNCGKVNKSYVGSCGCGEVKPK